MSSPLYYRSRQERKTTPDPRVAMARTMLAGLGSLSPDLAARLVFQIMIRPQRRRKELQQVLPAVSRIPITLDRRTLRGYQWSGTKRALLVHGWDSSSYDFRRIVAALQAQGWGGIAYDSPAHGLSPGRTTNFLDMEEALKGVLRAYGPFDVVIGHSLGAALTLEALGNGHRTAPGRLVVGAAPADLLQVFQLVRDQLRLPDRIFASLIDRITEFLGRPPSQIDFRQAASRIEGKILIVHDRQDPLFPISSAQRMVRALKRGRLLETSGLGHRGWLKDPQVHSQVTAFLAD